MKVVDEVAERVMIKYKWTGRYVATPAYMQCEKVCVKGS